MVIYMHKWRKEEGKTRETAVMPKALALLTPRRRLLFVSDGSDCSEMVKLEVGHKLFKIHRLADTDGCRYADAANMLIQKMYSWRGYANFDLPVGIRHSISWVATDHHHTAGTLTLVIDSATSGLLADEIYQEEIDRLRMTQRHVCEMTKLAIDQPNYSRFILATLFHMGYIHARYLFGCTDLVIEVNPRHVRYYENMFGFKAISREKVCLRVNAPAVLLKLSLAYAERQIETKGGLMEKGDKTIYPYCFSKQEELRVCKRLRELD
jgi:hypothetical protein